MSRWWPSSFFLGAVVMFIVGGALVGSYLSNANCFSSSYFHYNDDDWDCTPKRNGKFYAAVACFIVGGVFKLIAWILLILYCIKRRRSREQGAASQYYTVPIDPHQPYNVPGPYESQPQYPSQSPQPMYPDTAYHSQTPVNKEPVAHYN